MAAPGYPNMPGQMPMGGPMGGPPMGGPPMGGPPMGGMMPQRTVRRGTSKAVPVVISAGLAVGVFCGLLFGVGTGKEASATTTTASNAKKLSDDEPKADPGAAPTGLGATAAKPVESTPPAGTGSAAGSAAPAVAAAGSAAGSGAGSAKPAASEEKQPIKVTLVVKPDGAANDAKIKIDGKDIDGLVADLPAGTKSFKVEIRANGYRTYENKFNAMPDASDMKVELELTKRPAAGTGTRPPKRPDRPTNAGGAGGGLIDI